MNVKENILVRSAVAADLEQLLRIDHSYQTDYVWQMDIRSEDAQVDVSFREVRLPRAMQVAYPRDAETLPDEWANRTAFLVAEREQRVVGYAGLMEGMAPGSLWVTDMAVEKPQRRQGIGAALVGAAHSWAAQHGDIRLVLEMQSKNYPAICLANKLGFEFSGYSDQYYANQDIALFFSKRLH